MMLSAVLVFAAVATLFGAIAISSRDRALVLPTLVFGGSAVVAFAMLLMGIA